MRAIFVGLLTIALVACSSPAEESYDLVILNGRVMDPETELDAVRNVGIKDGVIVTITEKEISGADSLDAAGHVVTAGFIDTHTHGSDKFTIKMSMMDGVTSGMDYEAGAMNIAAWYEREEGKWPMNYGQCVPHEAARMIIHDGLEFTGPTDATNMFDLRAQSSEDDGVEGWSVTVSTLDQINEITKILDENLRQGALCVGSTVGYASAGISTYEQFEIQRVAARYGRPIGVHSRFHTSAKPPVEGPLGFDEVFTNAALLEAPLLYCHNNDYGWWEIEEKLALARDLGMNMWAEYYPYAAGSTAIGAAALRPASMEKLGLKYAEVMFDPNQNRYLSEDEYLQVVAEDPGRTVIVFNPPRKEWMKHWLRMPHMTVGSDSMWSTDSSLNWDSDPAEFSGHPRTSGAHTIVLRMAREAGVPLMFTLSQLSYWPALHLGDTGLEMMQARGRMQEGMAADIVVFDPDHVAEGSSYEGGKNGLPPIGLPHVIVNGQFVKRDDKATDVMAGQPIRYPVEAEGRHVPATTEQWLEELTIDHGSLTPRE